MKLAIPHQYSSFVQSLWSWDMLQRCYLIVRDT